MTEARDRLEGSWEEGWGGHERAQLRRLATLSLAEKLRWLEEAHELVTHLTRARPSPVAPGGQRSRDSS